MKDKNIIRKIAPKDAIFELPNGKEIRGEKAWYMANGYQLWSRSYSFMGYPNTTSPAPNGQPLNNAPFQTAYNIQGAFMRPQILVNELYATAGQDVTNLAEFKGWVENSLDSETSKDIKRQLINSLGINKGGGLIRYTGLPTTLSAVVGGMTVKKRQVFVSANDRESKRQKLSLLNKKKGMEVVAAMMPPELAQMMPQPKEEDYALSSERVIQKGVNSVINQGNYSIQAETGMNWNGVTNAIFGLKLEITPDYGISYRNVDMAYMCMGMPTKMDCSDLQAIGEIRFMTIADLKKYDTKGEYTDKDWGSVNNLGTLGFTFPNQNGVMNDLRAAVLDFEFYADDREMYRQTENGVYPVAHDYQPQSEKSKVVAREYVCVYKAMWVINTDIVVNYGKAPFQARGAKGTEEYRKPYFTYIMYCPALRSAGQRVISLVGSAIDTVNKMQICMLNFLYELAQARATGYTVDLKVMQDIAFALGGTITGEDGKEVLSDPYVATNLQKIGVYITGATDRNIPGAPKEEIPQMVEGGVSKGAVEYLEMYFRFRDELSELMGIPKGSDATLPDAKQPVRTQQAAMSSSQNMLSQITDGVEYIWSVAYKIMAKVIPQIFAEKKLGGIEYTCLSQFFEESEEELLAEIGLKLIGEYEFNTKKSPTIVELQELSASLDMAIQAGTIGIGDKFRFMNIAESDLQEAINELRATEEAKAIQEQRNAIEIQEANGKQQILAVQAANEAKLKEIAAETAKALKEIEAEKWKEMELLELKLQIDGGTQIDIAKKKAAATVEAARIKAEADTTNNIIKTTVEAHSKKEDRNTKTKTKTK